jgi:hypothetical protein
MNCNHNDFTLFMESKVREVISQAIPVLSSKKIEDIRLIRKREGKFIWQVFLSPKNTLPESVFVKAIRPKKKNLSEIMLYEKNPEYLRCFFPTVYGVVKKHGFYWLLLEELKQLFLPAITLDDFKKPIEFMASLHMKFYSNTSVIGNKQINWAPHFKKQWQRRMNRFKLYRQLKKYAQSSKTMRILKEDGPYIKNIIKNSRKILNPLLDTPHSLIHGCFDYIHIYLDENGNFRLIDWENFSFAPVTLDLVYLIEKSIDHGINDTVSVSQFRNGCLNYYCAVMKNCGINIEEIKFRKLYNLTVAFKIITQFIFEELKKIEKDKFSNYNFYRDQLFALDESLNLTG